MGNWVERGISSTWHCHAGDVGPDMVEPGHENLDACLLVPWTEMEIQIGYQVEP